MPTSREREVMNALQSLLQSASNSNAFSTTFSVEAKFLPRYEQEDFYDTLKVNVSALGVETEAATRSSSGFGKKTIRLLVMLTKHCVPDTTAWNNLVDLASDIDDYIQAYTGTIGGATWTGSSSDPLFDFEKADQGNNFHSNTIHTFTIVERPRF